MACDDADIVLRIDTATNAIVDEIDVGDGPHTIAIGGGLVWVTNRGSSQLMAIDPSTNAVVFTIDDVATSPGVGVAVNQDGSSVWVAFPGGVAEVDAQSGTVSRRFIVPGPNGHAFYDLEFLGDTLWASDAVKPAVYGFLPP